MVKKATIENSDNNIKSNEFSKRQFGKIKDSNNRIVHKKKSNTDEKDKKIEGEKSKIESENINKSYTRVLFWFVGIIVVLGLVFFIARDYFKGLNEFEYEGLKFVKEKFGEIPIYRYSYNLKLRTTTGQFVTENSKMVELYLRGDPRKNQVPIGGEIDIFSKGKDVFLSIGDNEIPKCDYSIIAVSSFSSLMVQNDIESKVGTSDKEIVKNDKLDYITCENKPNNPVIWIKTASKTQVTKKGENCYIMEVNNCETLPAMEKFMVQAIIDAKEKAINSN